MDKVLIIGGGIAGMEAAGQLLKLGYEPVIAEKEDHLGGHVAGWHKLFPDMMDAENPWGLYGTYQSRVAHHMGVIGSSLLDSTPDCQVGTPNSFPRIGAFHAYLLGYHTGSQYDDGPKMMFVDETNNISEIPEGKTQVSPIFDLQGRQLHGTPQKGVYIQDGRKYMK